jgi:predicted metalloprotease with PDZ domain
MPCRKVLLVDVALALALAACARPGAPVRPAPSCEYDVTPPPAGSWTVRVEARLRDAPGPRLVDPGAAGALRNVVLVEAGAERPVPRERDGWLAPACREACTLRYELDLAALADGCRGHECPRRVGEAFLGAASEWMLRPEAAGDAEIRVALRGDPARFATGLRRDGHGGYVLRARELGEAAYTAFGELRRSRVDVPGGPLDVVLLGPPLAMGDAAALAWVKDAATCVARLYGSFPAQATIFVIPVRGAAEVVFGRVMSLAGGSVALLFGSETRAASEHSDWVVVHELSHLGTASLVGEGHWLEEGLATYYEPVLRERAGWMSEAELWKHFVDQMPRGEPRVGDPPALEERDDIDSTYWGGALFCMLADLEIRKASHGARSLDDVMRAVHDRLGDATHGTRLADFLRVGDEATGTGALADVFAHFATAGEPVDLAATWQALGVVTAADGSVTLRDDAPLAAVRRGIAAGGGH